MYPSEVRVSVPGTVITAPWVIFPPVVMERSFASVVDGRFVAVASVIARSWRAAADPIAPVLTVCAIRMRLSGLPPSVPLVAPVIVMIPAPVPPVEIVGLVPSATVRLAIVMSCPAVVRPAPSVSAPLKVSVYPAAIVWAAKIVVALSKVVDAAYA